MYVKKPKNRKHRKKKKLPTRLAPSLPKKNLRKESPTHITSLNFPQAWHTFTELVVNYIRILTLSLSLKATSTFSLISLPLPIFQIRSLFSPFHQTILILLHQLILNALTGYVMWSRTSSTVPEISNERKTQKAWEMDKGHNQSAAATSSIPKRGERSFF